MPPRQTAKRRFPIPALILTSVAVLGLLAAGGYFGLKWWRNRGTSELRAQAFALFEQGKFEQALGPLSKVVSRDRDKKDAEAIRRLAKARLMVPELNYAHIGQAARFYAAAIAADPSDAESHRELLKLYFSMRQMVEAERTAEALLKLDPSDPTATQMLAAALKAKGDLAGAEKLLVARIKDHPQDFDAKQSLWEIWRDSGRSPEECLAEVDRWLAAPDADPALRVIKAERLRAAGRFPEARAEIDSLADSRPKSVASCLLVSRSFQWLGRSDAARRFLAEGARAFGPGQGTTLASELYRMGWLSDDLDAAAEGITIARSDPTARWTGRAAITLEFLRKDPKTLEDAIAAHTPAGATANADREFSEALRETLAALKDRSAMPRANAAIERALASNPKDPVVRYAQSELRLASGDRGSAIAAANEAFEDSGSSWVRLGLMLVPALEEYGDRAKAKAVLNTLSERQPGHPQVQMMLVLASADAIAQGEPPVIPQEQYANLARSLDREVETNPQVAPLAVLALATSDQAKRARGVIDRVLKNPDTTGAGLLDLARIVRRTTLADGEDGRKLVDSLLAAAAGRGAAPVQIEAFRAVEKGGEQSLPTLLALADGGDVKALRAAAVLAERNVPERAGEILERLVKDDPTTEGLTIVLNSQTALADPGLLERAIAAAEKLEGGRGDSTVIPRARLLLAKGTPTREQLDTMLAELDDVRQRRGETAELLAAMVSLLLAGDPPDITAASRLAGKAATLAPDRGQLQLLATALFRQAGNNDSATLYLQKAMASPSAKNDPTVRRGIVDELRMAGQHKNAAAEARGLAAQTNRSFDWMLAADLSQIADDRFEIERCLRAAVAAPDAQPATWSRLAIGLGQAGRLDDARAVLEEFKRANPESTWLPIEVNFDLGFGPSDAAIAALDAAYATYPDDPSLMLNKARERIVKGDPAAAIEIAKRAATMDAARLVARDIALQLVGAPDPIGSAALDALAAAGGIAAEPLRQLRAMRDGAEAASGSRALEIARTVPGLWTVWAFALDVAQAANDPVNRMLIAEEAARSLPGEPRALAALGSILLEQGRPGEAGDVGERLRLISGAAPEFRAQAIRMTALGQLGTGQAGRAKEILLAAVKETEDPDALMLASAIDTQLGRVSEGYARAAPTIAKSDPALVYWLRLVGSLAPKDAKAVLEAASAHEARMPNFFASAWVLASGRDDAAGHARAARLLEMARAAGKPSLETAAVEFELALARDDRAAIEKARAAFAAELDDAARDLFEGKAPAKPATDPKSVAAADAATTEVKALLERGRDLERAQKLIEAAVAAQGTLDQRVTLARVLAARGQHDAAAELALRLTRQNPGFPDAWAALARARLAKRDREAALLAIEQGQKSLVTAFFVAPKVKAELDTMTNAIAALSGRK